MEDEEDQAVESPREQAQLEEEEKKEKKGGVVKRKTSVNKRNGGSSLPTPKVDIWQRNEMEKHRKMKEANLKRAKETSLREKNQQDKEEQEQKEALKRYKDERKEAYEKYLRANNRKNEENYLRQKPPVQNAYNKVNVQIKENIEDNPEEASDSEKVNPKKSKRQWMPRPVPLDNAEQHLKEQQIEKELYENQMRQVVLMKQRNALAAVGGSHSIVEEDEREEAPDISFRDKDMKQSQFTVKGEEYVYIDSEDERERKYNKHNNYNKSSVESKHNQKGGDDDDDNNNEDYYNDKHLSIVESTYDVYGQREDEDTGFFGFGGGQVLAKVSGDDQEEEQAEKGRHQLQQSKKGTGSVASQDSKNKKKKQAEEQRDDINRLKNTNSNQLSAQQSPSYASNKLKSTTVVLKSNEDLPWPLNEINQQNERYSSPKPLSSYPSVQSNTMQLQDSLYQQSPQLRQILPPLSNDFSSQQPKSNGFLKQSQKSQVERQESANTAKNNLDEQIRPKSISAIQQQLYNPLTSNDLAQLKLKQEQLIKEKAELKRTEQLNSSQNPQLKAEGNASPLQQTQLIEDFKQQFNDLKKEYNYHRQQSKNLIASKEQKERRNKQNHSGGSSKPTQLASPKDVPIVRKTQQSLQKKIQGGGGDLDEAAELQYEQGEEYNNSEDDLNAQLLSQSGRLVRRTNHFKDVSKFSKKSLLDQQNSTQSSQLSYAQNMKERRKFWEKNTQEDFLNQPIEEKAKITAISKFRSKLNNKISSDKQLNSTEQQQDQIQQQQKQEKKTSEAQEWKALNEQEVALQREILSMHLDNFERVKQVEDKNNISLTNAVNNSEIMKSRAGSAVSNITTKTNKTNKTSKSKVSSITTNAEKAGRGSLKQINPISEIENEDDLEASLMKLEEQLNQKKTKINELADDLAQQLKPKNPELQRILIKNPGMLEQNPFSVDLTNQDKEYLENQKKHILMLHQQQSSPVISSKNINDNSRMVSRESRESRLQPKNVLTIESLEQQQQQQSVSQRERKQWDVKSKAGSTVRSSSNSLFAGRQQLSSAAKDMDRLDTMSQYQSNTRLTDQSPITNGKSDEQQKQKSKKGGMIPGAVGEVGNMKLNPEIIQNDKEELTKWWKSMQATSESKLSAASQTPKNSRGYNSNLEVSNALKNNTTAEEKDTKISSKEEQNALRRKQQLKAEFMKELQETETNELTKATRNDVAAGENNEQTHEAVIQREKRTQERSQTVNDEANYNDESVSVTPPVLRKKLTDVLDKNLIAKVEYSQAQIEQTIQSTLQRIEAVERQQIKAELENKKKQLSSQNNKENGSQQYATNNPDSNTQLDCQLSEISHNASFADSEFSVVSGVGSYQTKQTIKKQFKLTGKVPSRYPHADQHPSLSRNSSFQQENNSLAGLQQIAENNNEYKEIILEEEDQGDIKINKNVNLQKLLFVD